MEKGFEFDGYLIRRNDVSTVDDAVSLSASLYAESGESFGFDRDAVKSFIIAMMRAGGLLLVAYSDSEAKGYIVAAKGGNPITGRLTAEEIAVFVRKDSRGGRLGKKLVDMFEDWGRGFGARSFAATVQDSINHDATVGMFVRRGYRRQETRLIKEA